MTKRAYGRWVLAFACAASLCAMPLPFASSAAAFARPTPSPSPSPTPEETPLLEIVVTPATPTPTPSPSPTPTSIAAPVARNETVLIGGTWACKTFDGTTMTHVFSRDESGTAVLVDTVVTLRSGKTATLHEHYQYTPEQNQWTADIADVVRATSPGWTNSTWPFNGTAHTGKLNSPIRMTFYLNGYSDYRREFQRQLSGAWATYSGEACHRDI